MKLRIVSATLVALLGLLSAPAGAYWGGVDSISDKVDPLITIEVLPLNAEVRLMTITAPGFIRRTLTVVTNSMMPQRVFVDLVPIRTP